jgi:exodeoxyribonuclease III
MHRHMDKPDHIDYCFVSVVMVEKIKSAEVGGYDLGAKYSDHVPVIVSLTTIKLKIYL